LSVRRDLEGRTLTGEAFFPGLQINAGWRFNGVITSETTITGTVEILGPLDNDNWVLTGVSGPITLTKDVTGATTREPPR
jgi:hypothetical protein